MAHFFRNMVKQLPDTSVKSFLNFLAQHHMQEYGEYFLFKKDLQEDFLKSYAFLKTADTIELDWYRPTEKKGTVYIVALTIDGDYIAADDGKTYVIPVSLLADDSEIYLTPVGQFFATYEAGNIQSQILAKINPPA